MRFFAAADTPLVPPHRVSIRLSYGIQTILKRSVFDMHVDWFGRRLLAIPPGRRATVIGAFLEMKLRGGLTYFRKVEQTPIRWIRKFLTGRVQIKISDLGGQ